MREDQCLHLSLRRHTPDLRRRSVVLRIDFSKAPALLYTQASIRPTGLGFSFDRWPTAYAIIRYQQLPTLAVDNVFRPIKIVFLCIETGLVMRLIIVWGMLLLAHCLELFGLRAQRLCQARSRTPVALPLLMRL